MAKTLEAAVLFFGGLALILIAVLVVWFVISLVLLTAHERQCRRLLKDDAALQAFVVKVANDVERLFEEHDER